MGTDLTETDLTSPRQHTQGSLALAFAASDGRTRLARLYQASPCRALFPEVALAEIPQAVMINTAGGLVGGDQIDLSVRIGPGAAATVTTQAAEKIYRSLGQDCAVKAALEVAADADLEWLPQETILFDGARLDRRLKISLAPSSRLLATETVLFGRSARAERLSYGHLHDSWAIRIGDTLTWTDAIRLSGDIAAARARPFGFGDAAGYATVVIAGRDAPTHLDAARAIAAASPAQHSGATLVNGILILRLMDADAARLRTAVAQAAAALRAIVMGRAAVLPRAWSL